MKAIRCYRCERCEAEVHDSSTALMTHEHIVEQLVGIDPSLYYAGHPDEKFKREMLHYCDSDNTQVGICKLAGIQLV